jgi:hypothetical protein
MINKGKKTTIKDKNSIERQRIPFSVPIQYPNRTPKQLA